MIIIIMKQI